MKAVDTTGAGDSFTAGLIYGWSNGMSLRATALTGSLLGALAASVYGAGLALPGRQEAIEFIRSLPPEKTVGHKKELEEIIDVLKNETNIMLPILLEVKMKF